MIGRNTLKVYKTTRSTRTHKAICPECKGNGYKTKYIPFIQVWKWGIGYSKIIQCKTCKSGGEIVYNEPKLATVDGTFNGPDDHGSTLN